MAFVGLDPSLTGTGIAVWEDGAVTTHLVESKGKRDDSWQQRLKRITGVADRVVRLIPEGASVAIESPAFASSSPSTWDRAGLWWSIYRGASEAGSEILTVTPAQRAKYATGKGNAGKDAVLAATVRRYLDIEVTDNNVADAVIIMAMLMRALGVPLEEDLPKAHLSAMDKIRLERANV